jgi:lipoprotein-anchoring transpeptidase ErfK/SrfK
MRLLVAFCLLLVVAAAAGVLGATAPAADPTPVVIKPGVRVGNVKVGGLTSEPARARLRAAFDRPLVFRLGQREWSVRPSKLGAGGMIDTAVTKALRAPARERLTLRVRVRPEAVRVWTRHLAKEVYRAPQNAELAGLAGLTPSITDGVPGIALRTAAAERVALLALRAGWRGPFPVPTRPVEPGVTAANFGPVIVIRRGSNSLYLYAGESLVRSFPVATGQAVYPTPLGQWSIVDMQVNPWWRPPDSPWAQGLKPIPPGPGNPLGTRWMGLSAPGVGIHGTPDAASVGYSASHGCIRMYIPDATWLFDHVRIGTPVFIVSA